MDHKLQTKSEPRQVHVLTNLGSIYFQSTLYAQLKRQKVLSKPTGLTHSTKNYVEFIDSPYLIGKYYTALLSQKHQLCSNLNIKLLFPSQSIREQLSKLTNKKQYLIFKHFAKDSYLLQAHKFGGLFLVYENDPDKNHAKCIIFNGELEVNHMSRLAAISKKIGLFVEVNQQKQIFVQEISRIDNKKRERKKQQKEEDSQESQKDDLVKVSKKVKLDGK